MSSQKRLLGCVMGLIFLTVPRLVVGPATPTGSEYGSQIGLPGASTAPPPTPAPSATPALLERVHGQPPLSLTLMLGFTICALGLVVGVIVIGMIAGAQRSREETGVHAAGTEKASPSKSAGESRAKKRPAEGKRKKPAGR